jgi:hypothetical protein
MLFAAAILILNIFSSVNKSISLFKGKTGWRRSRHSLESNQKAFAVGELRILLYEKVSEKTLCIPDKFETGFIPHYLNYEAKFYGMKNQQ